MNRERLLKLAAKLDTVPSSMFDMSTVVGSPEQDTDEDMFRMFAEQKCGAAGCAIGWCPVVFPELLKYSRYGSIVWVDPNHHYHDYEKTASELFSISISTSDYLFSPGNYDDMHDPKAVANRIRSVVGGYVPTNEELYGDNDE